MTYSVEVDREGCIGSGQCMLFAPQVFQVRDGVADVLDPSPEDELYEAVLDAADACPVQAVLVGPQTPRPA